jgi:hypothetical protein
LCDDARTIGAGELAVRLEAHARAAAARVHVPQRISGEALGLCLAELFRVQLA